MNTHIPVVDEGFAAKCEWWVEFTDMDGDTHSEPARCSPDCEFPDTKAGAKRFARRASRLLDQAPPRVYSVATK